MEPRPIYSLYKKKVNRSVDGTPFSYDEVAWSRNNSHKLFLRSLLIIATARYLSLSRYWYFVSFAPALILSYSDKKFVPYGEIENFYNYVYERRKAESLFKNEGKAIEEELNLLDKTNYNKIKSELVRSNKTLYEAAHELDELYLQAAIRNDSHLLMFKSF